MSTINDATSNVSGTRKYDPAADRAPKNKLGQDEFMNILVAQLSHQDPLEPVKDTDFIAQMAQFTALEQTTALNKTFELSQAYSLVGKMVSANVMVDGFSKEVFGLVDYAYTSDGKNYLQVGDTAVPLSSVTGVTDASQYNGINSSLSEQLLSSGNLIGKTITAMIVDQSTESGYSAVTGVVERVFVDDSKQICATVNGVNVRLNMITQISETTAAVG